MICQRVLVPLDGSALAETVLPQVEELAKRVSASITLLRAAWAHYLPGLDGVEVQLHAVQEAEEYVATVERRLRARGFDQVDTAVWYSTPVSAILEHAEWHNVDLIAMSSHGRGGLSRLFAGSVATKVLEAANSPVLLHRPLLGGNNGTHVARYRRVLVPLDGSELAETVLPAAIALSKAMGAEVVLLQVVPRQVMADQAATRGIKALVPERLAIGDYLDLVRAHVAEQGVEARWTLRSGVPAEQIAYAADQHDVDLIAMATHGRSAVGRLVRGSVADAVMQTTSVPLLLTRSATVVSGSLVLSQHA